MNAALEKVQHDALSLSGEDRARLAEKLWESLADEAGSLSEAWQTEIERRRREVREGGVKLVPGADVSHRAGELAKQNGR